MKDTGDKESIRRKWKAIRSLLDDETPAVRNAVINELERSPDVGRKILNEIADGSDQFLSRHAQQICKCLGWIDVVADFMNFIRSQRYELETGWFLLDRTVYPSFEPTSSTLFLDKLADRVRELTISPMNPKQTCSIINRVLFHEYGFRGAGKDFENPQNSILHRVLDRRQGLPITLSVTYLVVARRIGLDLEPVGLPGRFMVGCFMENRPFYIDSWSGGKILELEQMDNYLEHSSIEGSGSALLPVTVAETLARGCRNLVNHFLLSQEPEKSKMFGSFVKEFERVQRLAPNA